MRTNAQLYNLQVNSKPYKDTVNLQDKSKVNRRRQGERTTQPSSALAKVAWELGYRAFQDTTQPPPVPLSTWGIYNEPIVMLHNSQGGVEYQEEQVKYFGSVQLDMNNPNDWSAYITRAKACDLRRHRGYIVITTVMWPNCWMKSFVRVLVQAGSTWKMSYLREWTLNRLRQ